MKFLFFLLFTISQALQAQTGTYSDLVSENLEISEEYEEVIILNSKIKMVKITSAKLKHLRIRNSRITVLMAQGAEQGELSLLDSSVSYFYNEIENAVLSLENSILFKLKTPLEKIASISIDLLSKWENKSLSEVREAGININLDGIFVLDKERNLCLDQHMNQGSNEIGWECVAGKGELNDHSYSTDKYFAYYFNDVSLNSPSGEGFLFTGLLNSPRFHSMTSAHFSFRDSRIFGWQIYSSTLSDVDAAYSEVSRVEIRESNLLRWIFSSFTIDHSDISDTIIAQASVNSFVCNQCSLTNVYFHAEEVKTLEFRDTTIRSSELKFDRVHGKVIFRNVKFLDTDVSHLYNDSRIEFIDSPALIN